MLSVISIEEAGIWDGIVTSFKNYDVYYLSGYSKSFQLNGDGIPTLFYYEGEDIRAINVVMKRNIEKDRNFKSKLSECSNFDIITPYGYGGFLVEGETTKDSLRCLDDEYSNFCKKNGIISEFVRFHPLLKNNKALEEIYDVSSLCKTISIDLTSSEQIWAGLISKNRNMVRKAQKSGIEIYWGRDVDLYSDFIQMYNTTMDKDNAIDYYYFKEDFYKSILKDFKYNAIMFYAVYEGKKISMAIMLFANKKMHYHLSASDRIYQYLAPTNLLIYEAACWGSENGYETLHLGGGVGSSEDSLYKFKSSFNRYSDNIFTIGRKIFDEDKYKNLVNVRKNEINFDSHTGFFPAYRATFSELEKE